MRNKKIDKIDIVLADDASYEAWGAFKNLAEEIERIRYIQINIVQKINEIIEKLNEK